MIVKTFASDRILEVRRSADALEIVTSGGKIEFVHEVSDIVMLRDELNKIIGESSGLTSGGISDWTATDGKPDRSASFMDLSLFVGSIIRDCASDLLAGNSDDVGMLIMSRLAHAKGMSPRGR